MDDNQINNPQPNLNTPNAPVSPPAPPLGQQPPTNTPPQAQQPPSLDPQQQPQPEPPQLVDVPETKKGGPTKKLLTIILGFLFISALIVGGYYLFTLFTKDSASSTAQPTSLPQQASTSTPEPTIDPHANWKSYANTKFGFSFKHPADWTHNIGIGNNIGIAETEWSVLEGPYDDVSTATSGGIRNEISINSEESKLVFKDYLNETGTLFASIEEERNYEVGSITGYLFNGLINESVEGVITQTPAIVVIFNKESVYVKFKLKRFNPDDNTISAFSAGTLDEILSTFQFTQ